MSREKIMYYLQMLENFKGNIEKLSKRLDTLAWSADTDELWAFTEEDSLVQNLIMVEKCIDYLRALKAQSDMEGNEA
ncbi:hypothetical protein lbkm_1947 [Lachnospiraceae bacterium KM106-2]|nr:hypothetical protein lbkm_1947 [Lachnospiraceae bacterium KM106-2]